MRESSLEFLRCPACAGRMGLEPLRGAPDVEEGILRCARCGRDYPVLCGIPVLWDSFASYLSARRRLGGRLHRSARTQAMRRYVRGALAAAPAAADRGAAEERWARIYLQSGESALHREVRRRLRALPRTRLALEYGCSVGLMMPHLARTAGTAFGADRSLAALLEAKGSAPRNAEYVVADASSQAFSGARFGTVMAMNMLELAEPRALLGRMAGHVRRGHLVISDPYDYDRGESSVRRPLDARSLRASLRSLGFRITAGTASPSHHPWRLRINSRAALHYTADLVVARR